jgi:hypothetical protein
MNARTFLQQFEESHDRDRMVDIIYDEMVEYCRENDITEDDVSTPTLERLAEGFVERGFGIGPSDSTLDAKGRYRSDEFVQTVERVIENQENLGSASDGTELDE